MSVESAIHAALTISVSIDKHCEKLLQNSENLSQEQRIVQRLASGSRSGDAAVRLLGDAESTVREVASQLSGISDDLRNYAKRLLES